MKTKWTMGVHSNTGMQTDVEEQSNAEEQKAEAFDGILSPFNFMAERQISEMKETGTTI